MTLNDFRARLKSGNIGGWYIFAGEEDYLKRHYRTELSRAVLTDDAFDTFNHSVFDGQEMTLAAFRDALYTPPMMSDYKLIEWRHADLDKMKESDRSLKICLSPKAMRIFFSSIIRGAPPQFFRRGPSAGAPAARSAR